MRGFMLLLFIVLLLIVSSMDFEDQMIDHQRYCENVAQGYWPPFRGEGVCD